MKDVNGHKLSIGDKVAFCKVGNSRLSVGVIQKFTKVNASILTDEKLKFSGEYRVVSRAPDQLSKIENEWISVSNPPEKDMDVIVCVSFQYNRSKKIVMGYAFDGSFSLDDWCFEYEYPFIEGYKHFPGPMI